MKSNYVKKSLAMSDESRKKARLRKMASRLSKMHPNAKHVLGFEPGQEAPVYREKLIIEGAWKTSTKNKR